MLRYGFFDSEITGFDGQGLPIFDRAESSDFLAMFISRIISDGVLGQPRDCFQVLAGEGMALRIMPGFALIQGRFATDPNISSITVPTAHATHRRIDRVVLRANYPNRLCEVVVKEGVPAASPVPPDLLQPESGDYYEICLATVSVSPNQTVITQADITDTRYDSAVCGVVAQVIDHLDTSVLFAQLERFYEEFVARSDSSYDSFLAEMSGYLEGLQEDGDSQLKGIVDTLTAFEEKSEEDFLGWLQGLQGKLSEDVAGSLLGMIEGLQDGKLDRTGDTKDNGVTFESGDAEDPEAWTEFGSMESGESHASIFGKISVMARNLRFLWKALNAVTAGGAITEVLIVDALPPDAEEHPTTFYWVKG